MGSNVKDEFQNSFYLYGEEFSFDENDESSILLHKVIKEETLKAQVEFREECKKTVHNFDDVFTKGYELFSKKLEQIINKGIIVVDSHRQINISSKKFLEIGIRNQTLPINDIVEPLTRLLDILNDYIEQLGLARNIERSNRSQWEGGGFGIQGALWGAAKAGVLNYITDSVRGVSDHYSNQKDLAQIQKIKDKMYNEKCVEGMSPVDYLESSIEYLGYGVYLECCNMLGLDSLDGQRDFADEILEKIDNCYPVKRVEILKAIYNYPFYPEFYYQIFLDDEKSYNELVRITNYVGISTELKLMVKKWFIENKILPLAPKKDDYPEDAERKIQQLDKAMSDYKYISVDDVEPLVNSFKEKIREYSKNAEHTLSIWSSVENYLDERNNVNKLLESNELGKLFDIAQTSTKAYVPYKLRRFFEQELDIPSFTSGTDVYNAFTKKHANFINDMQEAGKNVSYIIAYANWKYGWINNEYDTYTANRNKMIKIAENGDLFALGKIGELLIWPDDKMMPKKMRDENKGVEFIVKAANALDPRAMYLLGKIYRIGYGKLKYDLDQCKLWFAAVVKKEVEAINAGKVGDKAKEGCFITTAACECYGKTDDCYELSMFRKFRDKWLIGQKEGKKLIEEYYEIAPIIVKKISQLINAEDIYKELWRNYLMPCLNDIENNNMMACMNRYKRMVTLLKQRYVD